MYLYIKVSFCLYSVLVFLVLPTHIVVCCCVYWTSCTGTLLILAWIQPGLMGFKILTTLPDPPNNIYTTLPKQMGVWQWHNPKLKAARRRRWCPHTWTHLLFCSREAGIFRTSCSDNKAANTQTTATWQTTPVGISTSNEFLPEINVFFCLGLERLGSAEMRSSICVRSHF